MATDPDSKVHDAIMGSIWGREEPSGPHVGPMNFAIWGIIMDESRKLVSNILYVRKNVMNAKCMQHHGNM